MIPPLREAEQEREKSVTVHYVSGAVITTLKVLNLCNNPKNKYHYPNFTAEEDKEIYPRSYRKTKKQRLESEPVTRMPHSKTPCPIDSMNP